MHGSGGGGVMGTNPNPPCKIQIFQNYTGMCASHEISHERFHVKFTKDTTGRVHYKIMKKYASDPPPGPLANSNNRRNRIRALYTCK